MNINALRDAVMHHKHLIPSPYDEIIDMDGFDAICALSHSFGGSSVYMPSLRTIFMPCIRQEICNQYSNGNLKMLASNFNLSERHIRNLLHR